MATDRSRISTDIDFEQEGFRLHVARASFPWIAPLCHIPIRSAVLKRGDGPTRSSLEAIRRRVRRSDCADEAAATHAVDCKSTVA